MPPTAVLIKRPAVKGIGFWGEKAINTSKVNSLVHAIRHLTCLESCVGIRPCDPGGLSEVLGELRRSIQEVVIGQLGISRNQLQRCTPETFHPCCRTRASKSKYEVLPGIPLTISSTKHRYLPAAEHRPNVRCTKASQRPRQSAANPASSRAPMTCVGWRNRLLGQNRDVHH